MDICFFTLASRNYLSYAASLMQSLRDAHPAARRVIGLVDDPDLSALPELDLAAEVLPIDRLAIDGLAAMKFRYSVLELNTAVKPFLFRYLMAERPDHLVIYLDPDIFVYRALDEVESLAEDGAGLVLTPHITAPLDDGREPDEVAILRSGVYNLGFPGRGSGSRQCRAARLVGGASARALSRRARSGGLRRPALDGLRTRVPREGPRAPPSELQRGLLEPGSPGRDARHRDLG